MSVGVYSRVATAVSSKEIVSFDQLVVALRSIYPSDEIFESSFSSKEFDTSNTRNRNVVKYILSKVERQTFGLAVDTETDDLSIEHILPENPGQAWPDFSEDDIISNVFRLGNMTLLEVALNKDAGNKSYEDKKIILKKSAVKLSLDVIEKFDQWKYSDISKRQKQMAKIAKTIWRVDQLSL